MVTYREIRPIPLLQSFDRSNTSDRIEETTNAFLDSDSCNELFTRRCVFFGRDTLIDHVTHIPKGLVLTGAEE